MLFTLLCILNASQSQDFVIVHDIQKDSTNLYKVGKTENNTSVKEIGFRKPGRITLKVNNFNPFYWNAKVSTKTKIVDEESGHIGMFMTSMTKVLGVSGFPSLSRGAGEDQEKIEKLHTLYNQLEEYGLQLKELKYNIQKSEAEIKSETRMIGAEVMALMGKDDLNPKEMRLAGKELDKNLNNLYKSPDRGLSLDDKDESQFSELIFVITNLHSEIVNSSFKFQSNIKYQSNMNEIILKVYPRPDSNTKVNSSDTITKIFSVQDKTLLKIRNSVGMTFTFFPEKNRSYYINPDLTIGNGNADFFTPVISTYINFYSSNTYGLKWGGTFGFGIPLIGEKKDINLMLGLCTALGKNEPIVLSFGIAGTKVEKLANGWKVGQVVPSQSFNIPKLSQFRPGGFISISFNTKAL